MVSSQMDSGTRRESLRLAAVVRDVRRQTIDGLRSGELAIGDVLASRDPFIGHIKVVTAVESLPQLGKVVARRILDELAIPGQCTIRSLDERQRHTLVDRIGDTV